MSVIKVAHGTHEIVYNEKENMWECFQLGFCLPSLAEVKRKIDKHDRAARTAGQIKVIRLDRFTQRVEECTVTTVDKAGDRAWCNFPPKGGIPDRRRIYINQLVADTEANRRLIQRFLNSCSEADEARSRVEAAFKAIPTLTKDELLATKIEIEA